MNGINLCLLRGYGRTDTNLGKLSYSLTFWDSSELLLQVICVSYKGALKFQGPNHPRCNWWTRNSMWKGFQSPAQECKPACAHTTPEENSFHRICHTALDLAQIPPRWSYQHHTHTHTTHNNGLIKRSPYMIMQTR